MGISKFFGFAIFVIFCNQISTTFAGESAKPEDIVNICEDNCLCDNIIPYLIDCTSNRLIEIYDPVEWNLTVIEKNLTGLDLDVRFNDNKIKVIPIFPSLKIVNLSFRNNEIKQIEENAFANLDFLLSLDLSYNLLTAQDLPEQVFWGKLNTTYYRPLPLQHLNLSNNNVHSFEKDLFEHMPALTSLDLSYNPIQILDGSTAMSLAYVRKLKFFSLAHTQIKSIPAGLFHDMQFLESLDLTGNEFEVVPQELRYTHNLTVLILDDNNFESLNFESFIGLSSLQTLSISYNTDLKLIEERTFSPLKSLLSLSCHHNEKLDRINNAAFFEIYMKDGQSGKWPVKEIALNDNALTHIDEALAEWENVQVIDIQNNPFRCDCNAKWMIQTLVHQIADTHKNLAKDLVCASPDVLKGDNVLDLSVLPQIFSKCDTDLDNLGEDIAKLPIDSYQAAGITILTIGIILLVICFAILGVIVVKRRAIASALVAHQEIRYKRADIDDNDAYRSPSSHIYRVA